MLIRDKHCTALKYCYFVFATMLEENLNFERGKNESFKLTSQVSPILYKLAHLCLAGRRVDHLT